MSEPNNPCLTTPQKSFLTKSIIPLNLSESDILRTQKSTFQSENVNEKITH